MGIQLCESCNAPLPLASPGTIINCNHCNTDNFIKNEKSDPANEIKKQFHHSMMKSQQIIGSNINKIILSVFVFFMISLLFVCLMIFIYPFNQNQPSELIELNDKFLVQQQITRHKNSNQIELKNLSIVDKFDGWAAIEHNGLPSTFNDINTAECIIWMVDAAKYWSNDVVIERVSINHFPLIGNFDLTTDKKASLEVRFCSPAKFYANKKMKAVSEEVIPWYFRVKIDANGVKAYSSKSSAFEFLFNENTSPETFCEAQQLIENALKKGIASRPFYDITLMNSRKKWEWTIKNKEEKKRILNNSCQ